MGRRYAAVNHDLPMFPLRTAYPPYRNEDQGSPQAQSRSKSPAAANSEVLADKARRACGRGKQRQGELRQFVNILNKLYALGFFPEISLVSAVAKAM